MVEVNLVSALAMGAVFLAIVLAVRRVRNWHAAPAAAGGAPSVADAFESPATLSAIFLAIAVAAVLVVVATVGGTIPGLSTALARLLLVALFGLGLAGLLAGGVYATARNRGLPRSMAVAAGSVTIGALVLLVILAKLVTGA